MPPLPQEMTLQHFLFPFATPLEVTEEPPGAGLIRSAPLTTVDEQEIATFIAASKQRNAALIQRLRTERPPDHLLPAPGSFPQGSERHGHDEAQSVGARGKCNRRPTEYFFGFVQELPALRLGVDIVVLLKTYIPGTFTYQFVGGVVSAGDLLLKAHRLNPGFEGIQATVVTCTAAAGNDALQNC